LITNPFAPIKSRQLCRNFSMPERRRKIDR
jgi:hypothetical protein